MVSDRSAETKKDTKKKQGEQKMMTWQAWTYILGGYLSGSILYSYLLPKALKGIDITAESPDGNPGTANAFACAGVPVGILVLCMELLKGYLPVHLAAQQMDVSHWSFALILVAPVLGHAYPFFQSQKGGKAIAVSFGVLLGIVPFWFPVLTLAVLYLFFSLIVVIEPHFYRSVCTFVLFSATVLWRAAITSIGVGCCLISAVVIRKHYARYRGEQMKVHLALRRS